jgi:hypothetical protein
MSEVMIVGSLTHILPKNGGLMTRGSSRVDKKNPKELTYIYSVEDIRRYHPRFHGNYRDHPV